MTIKQKIFLFVDILILVVLFLISSTDYVWKERKVDVSNISVIVDIPLDSTNINLREGAKKAAQAYHADMHFLNLRDYEAQQVDMQTLVQRELDAGCEGIVLQCGSRRVTEEILENIPVGIPVVLWDTEAESPRVKAHVSFDREAIARLLVEKVSEARDKGQSVTLVSHKDCGDQVQNMHDLLEELFPQAGIMVRRVELADYAETQALVSGLTVQGGNMVVSCDGQALEAMAQVCENNDYKLPLYGMGWSGMIREQLEKGNIAGVAVTDAYGAGYHSVQKLTMILTGTDQDGTERNFQTVWVTGENMYDRSREAILFPFA